MNTTITTAQSMLQRYLDAEIGVLAGKSVSLGGRTLTQENLGEIRKGRQEWERKVARQQAGAVPTIGGLGYSVSRFDTPRG